MHNLQLPEDVNLDRQVTPIDALSVINSLNASGSHTVCVASDGESALPNELVDVNADGLISPLDALLVVNYLNQFGPPPPVNPWASQLKATLSDNELLGPQNLLLESEVKTLLKRASQASPSQDAIIAVVDRAGRILGVRVEAGVSPSILNSPQKLAFAIDGAVAKARTAAFFSSNDAPLPSRTVRFISQSTVTQREVESSPLDANELRRGPGFVAPIGVGGHFPPEISFAPQVDLFAIEHQSRDRQLLDPGQDQIAGTADDLRLMNRFNVRQVDVASPASGSQSVYGQAVDVAAMFTASGADQFFETWPESYGVQAGTVVGSQARGIATLPGGVPLYKAVTTADGSLVPIPATKQPRLPEVNLVGGIGVFFPGPDGYASYEQGFVPAVQRGGVAQRELERVNASRVLESEFIALAAAAGTSNAIVNQLLAQRGLEPTIGVSGTSFFRRDFREFDRQLTPLPNFTALNGRIDLVGITLEIYGPTPTQSSPIPGIDRLIQVGRALGPLGVESGSDLPVHPSGQQYLRGQAVPEQWLLLPRDAYDGSITAAQVKQIIDQAVAQAQDTRAAIRLQVDNNFRPGARTAMVLAVADKRGDLLGLYRMPDATVFSIDVSIAKARNTVYYADAQAIVAADRIDFNGDGLFGPVTTVSGQLGDTVPTGTALTNRTFRFLVEPRYPTGADLPQGAPGPQSILTVPGINSVNAENLGLPLPYSVYANPAARSTTAFDAFVPGRNFRDPGDAGVVIADSGQPYRLANQNGVVFFPGSTPLYVGNNLSAGFGVSGDGVDQDDVVTASGQQGFAAPDALRVDQYFVGGVRLPFQKFNRNPLGS